MTLQMSPGSTWWDIHSPFRHIVVENLLESSQYAELSNRFKSLRAGSDRFPGRDFRRSSEKYDALILPMDSDLSREFLPFFDAPWLISIASLIGIPFLPVVDGALHSSPPGSRTGWIHSDYCSAWFHNDSTLDGGILFPDRSRCDYFTGKVKSGPATPRRYVRAVSLLYYLNNDDWQPGDGGETELLAASREFPRASVKRVEPLNNRLLIFPCSRHSFHRFIANRRERNSLILWMHVTPAMANTLWGPPTH
jgi:hypothetical protein